MSAAAVLPFLAALKKNLPDFSGMTADNDPTQQFVQAAQPGSNSGSTEPMISAAQGDSSQVPPLPPGQIAQRPPSSLPDLGTGEQAPTPEDKGSMFREPYETKGHALLRILQGGLMGGLSGYSQNAQTYAATGRNAGFGGGAAAGYTQALPMQKALQGLELQKAGLTNEQLIQMLPFLRAQNIAGLQKTTAEAQKNIAEAGKATAETGAVATKQKLEEAQATAAEWKEEPATGLLRNVRTGETMSPGDAGMAILDAPSAAILGKQAGDRVPLKIAKQAKDLVESGITPMQANGRSLLVDKSSREIVKDMGAATPMAVINAQMSGPATTATGALADPNMEKVAQAVAAGQEDMATALRPYIRFPGKANALEARALQINPNYYQGDYQNRLKVLEKATAGSWADQKVAFNTAMQHADLLDQAAKALNNGDVRTLASLKNRLNTEFGDADYTNFQAISHAYVNEIQKMLSAGHITDAEISQNSASMPANANYATIHKVMSSYKALAQSKLNVLNKQIQQGMKGSQGLNQPSIQLGQEVTIGGRKLKVTSVHADGSFDAQ